VVGRARLRRCDTIQLFSRNPRMWSSPALDEKEAAVLRKELKEAAISPVFVHLPYLPNLAARSSPFYRRSVEVLCEDLCRAESLGASYVVTHMGNRLRESLEKCLDTLAESIGRALEEVENGTILLLENTSGQGTQIGWRFEEIGAVIRGAGEGERLGVCLDTAHAYGAGYDLSTREGLDATIEELDTFVGLEKLCLLHLNDTQVALGSRKDRHWHIGKGRIGLEGFRNIVNDPRLCHLPGIMETPQDHVDEDLENMSVIRSLVGGPSL